MQKLFWIIGLWLVGISPVLALDVKTPETLKFNVYWGFVRVGKAQLDYVPGARDSYVVRALVRDDSSLIDLDDAWESRGSHTAARPFVPAVYAVKQAENSYRADKTMTFDAKAGKVLYANRIDASDKAEPLVMGEARDVLATVYSWRLGGVSEVQRAAKVPMVSLKKLITLQRDAGVRTSLKIGNREMVTWKVRLTTIKDNGKPGSDVWTVYLRDDVALTPVQIVAATRFGTFRASLAE